jgi:hypothetical protein
MGCGSSQKKIEFPDKMDKKPDTPRDKAPETIKDA